MPSAPVGFGVAHELMCVGFLGIRSSQHFLSTVFIRPTCFVCKITNVADVPVDTSFVNVDLVLVFFRVCSVHFSQLWKSVLCCDFVAFSKVCLTFLGSSSTCWPTGATFWKRFPEMFPETFSGQSVVCRLPHRISP